MPRKSAAALAVKTPLRAEQRLAPPTHLSDAEREVWLQLINDQPAGAFTVTHVPLLTQYARHIVQASLIADELLNFNRAWLADEEGLKRYDRLLAMQDRETKVAAMLATRMRITRQSVDDTVIARSLVNDKKAKKPWELTFEAAAE